MAEKYGAMYVAKKVVKGLTYFGVCNLCGHIAGSICEDAGFGRFATGSAKIAGFTVGGMIAHKTSEYIDEAADRITHMGRRLFMEDD